MSGAFSADAEPFCAGAELFFVAAGLFCVDVELCCASARGVTERITAIASAIPQILLILFLQVANSQTNPYDTNFRSTSKCVEP